MLFLKNILINHDFVQWFAVDAAILWLCSATHLVVLFFITQMTLLSWCVITVKLVD